MKNYELMAFLAQHPADADIEIWGPNFTKPATIESIHNQGEPPLAYDATDHSIQITFSSYEYEEAE